MSKMDKFIGIPFVNGGRDISGCDCFGLCMLIHEEFGINIPDFRVNARNGCAINEIFKGEQDNPLWIKIDKPDAPCVVTMCLGKDVGGMVTHVGTYVGNGMIIHTLDEGTSSVFKLNHMFFKNKITGFYKYAKPDTSNGNIESVSTESK